MNNSLNPTSMFIQCPFCLSEKPDGESPQQYARQSVGITPTGDLVVWCQRHDEKIVILQNGSIDSTLAEIASASCSNCGHHHHGEEEKGN